MSISKRHILRPITLLTLLVISALVLTACDRRPEITNDDIRDRATDRLAQIVDELDASDAQSAQLQTVLDGALPTVFQMRETRNTYGKSIMVELMQADPDQKAVVRLVDELSTEMTKHAHTLADSAIAAHQVLNDTQRSEIDRWWTARAEDRRRPPAWMLDAIVKRGLDEIDASDAQYEYVLTKKEEWTKRGEEIRAEGIASRAVIRAELRGSNVDRKVVHAEIDKLSSALTPFARDVASSAAEFAGTLSDKQRKTIAKEFLER